MLAADRRVRRPRFHFGGNLLPFVGEIWDELGLAQVSVDATGAIPFSARASA